MAKNSKIEWTHHTFNPWWGCTRVSPACTHCYAETWARRVGQDVWGAGAPRRFFGAAHWREPLKWNADAASEGERRRVFCASMADVFEGRKELNPVREKLWELIDDTPWLDWLLLTKRVAGLRRRVPWGGQWPANVWLGATVENRRWAALRLPDFVEYPAAVRFLSCEPLLEDLDLTPWLPRIDWVIAGGESGHHARPMNPAWPARLRDDCEAAGVPFHFKQWGHWAPSPGERPARTLEIEDEDGHVVKLFGVGKTAAGRLLDGRTWDEFPSPRADAVHEPRSAPAV